MSGRLEITNLDMKVGTTLKVKGRIPDDADGNAGKTLAPDTPSPAKDPTTQNAPFSGALQVYPGSRTDPAKSNLVASVTGFAINLGQGAEKLGLHLNPRFKESTIVCNSKDGHWGAEQRDGHLCFGPGSEVKVTVAFQSDEFQVKLPDGHQLAFPNRMGLGHLSYLSVQGGLLVSSFKLD